MAEWRIINRGASEGNGKEHNAKKGKEMIRKERNEKKKVTRRKKKWGGQNGVKKDENKKGMEANT